MNGVTLRAVRSTPSFTVWIAFADSGHRVTFVAPRNAEASPHWERAIESMVARAAPVKLAWVADVWDDASAEREV